MLRLLYELKYFRVVTLLVIQHTPFFIFTFLKTFKKELEHLQLKWACLNKIAF